MLAVRLETTKEVNEFIDNLLLSVRDQIYKNVDALYANNKDNQKAIREDIKFKS